MELVKLITEKDVSSFSVDGKIYVVKVDKTIEIEKEYVNDAFSHGFILYIEETKETVKKGKK